MRPLGDLFELNQGVWTVGSTVWKPVTCKLGAPNDLDLVCEAPWQLTDLIKRAKAWAATLVGDTWNFDNPGYYAKEWTYRVTNSKGETILDVWQVPEGLTPEEHIMSFTRPEQRCALRPDGKLFRGILRGNPPEKK